MIPAFPLQWPEGWPRAKSRIYGKFFKGERDADGIMRQRNLSIEDSIKRVRFQLAKMRVSDDDMVVSTNLKLNLSGNPRGDQGEPTDPGVAVYWQPKNGPMKVMAIDQYYKVRDNIAAIASTLEAMRKIEQHGGATILDRAFTGFTALPTPESVGWRTVLGNLPDLATAELVYKQKAKEAAAAGGDHNRMVKLNLAIEEARQFFKGGKAA